VKPPRLAAPAKTTVDPAEISAALEASAQKVQQLRHTVKDKPQVTGYCHECQKPIVWGRLFCGACAADRDAGGIRRKTAAS
jgi:hypothetical protein